MRGVQGQRRPIERAEQDRAVERSVEQGLQCAVVGLPEAEESEVGLPWELLRPAEERVLMREALAQ